MLFENISSNQIKISLQDYIIEILQYILNQNNGHIANTVKELKISRTTFYNYMKKANSK